MRTVARLVLLAACSALLIACKPEPLDRGPEEPTAWLPDVQPDRIPDRPLVARIGGKSLSGAYVILKDEGPDRVRIEVIDARPEDACGAARGSLGLSVRIGAILEAGSRIAKIMSDEREGWSAFSVVRHAEGGAVSGLPARWSVSLAIDSMDARARSVKGRIAVAFADDLKSGAAGRFEGTYCPLQPGT